MTKIISVRWVPKDALDGMQALTPLEELAYRRIIDLIYVTENGLDDDDARMGWMTKTGKKWKSIKQQLIRLGKIEVINGKVVNKKCTLTLEEARQFIAQKSAAGNASADKRKLLKNNKATLTDVDTCVGDPLQRGSQRGGNQPLATSQQPVLSKEVSSAAKGDFEKVFDLGIQLFPNLEAQDTSHIHQWLNDGCDVELDIIPTLKRSAGVRIGTWKYFTKGIADAKVTRNSPMPAGKVKHSNPQPQRSPKPGVGTL